MRRVETSDLWWKSAVVYCLDVQTFMDLDGDGHGDFAGLTERIDYLAELGVTCLWLMPMHPTTDHDDGYDVTDYYGIDPRLGTHGDLVEAIRTARDRGIRVIIDLVVNHTSVEHPWFVAARESVDSPYRDFYVWRSDPPPDTSDQVFFPDEEDGIWEHDPRTDEYYLHHFYKHQPDLNIDNPRVREEVQKIMGFWLELGVAGFRVDAVPTLLALEHTEDAHGEHATDLADGHDYLRSLAAFARRRSGDAVLLGEVNLPHEEQVAYVGETGDQLTMVLDFPVMQRLFLALARQDARTLGDALAARPALPRHCQWAVFTRGHDELTLDQLAEEERREVFEAFGPAEEHRVFDRGLRRRLAPMLEGHERLLPMVHSLHLALPGTPVLYYGEELGMGENLDLDGRMAVRSPMQWEPGAHGGFSTSPDPLPRALTGGGYGPAEVNVADQRRDPGSLLSLLKTLLQVYRQCPELGWAEPQVLQHDRAEVLALRSTVGDRDVVTVHNFGPGRSAVVLDVDVPARIGLHDLLGGIGSASATLSDGRLHVELDGHGFGWFRLA